MKVGDQVKGNKLMCGIFGIIDSTKSVNWKDVRQLAGQAQRRGSDASGVSFLNTDGQMVTIGGQLPILDLLSSIESTFFNLILGHARLATNGNSKIQPLIGARSILLHNGIVTNQSVIRKSYNLGSDKELDSEVVTDLIESLLDKGMSLASACTILLESVEGTVNICFYDLRLNQLALLSNSGSLFVHRSDGSLTAFSSEKSHLVSLGIGLAEIDQINGDPLVFQLEGFQVKPEPSPMVLKGDIQRAKVFSLGANSVQEKALDFEIPVLKRCTKCILPHTFPFIRFDSEGVCNYCLNYKARNKPQPISKLFEFVEPYRRKTGLEVVIPFSGGRDSSHTLHLVTKELGLRAVTYTYDWGMVTDLGRRNISRMVGKLGVENIVISANLSRKRANIRKNLLAWLKNPDLGLIALLTAGDKHFFRYVEDVKSETGVNLNIWGVNPLEVTHFKTGFLGIPPKFNQKRVYSNGPLSQAQYHTKRFKHMLKSPGYFNLSLFDTLAGEYYRSLHKKTDYYHMYDFYKWEESEIDDLLINDYGWETATDTSTTWRIGDGTAAFYNYVYMKIAGFTEHDTFRSNQIREGDITRSEALDLVLEENMPRYPNIKWYLDLVDVDYDYAISCINKAPTLY